MRIFVYMLAGAFLLTSSCATVNKRTRNTETPAKTLLMPAGPVKEVRERLVSNNDKAPDNHNYFVIIGSFRSYGNALKHKTMVARDGFIPEILKNAAGLYRVSVKATDDPDEARAEVRRIWTKFPGYSDTWMLIQIK
jgi:hypothetical protein